MSFSITFAGCTLFEFFILYGLYTWIYREEYAQTKNFWQIMKKLVYYYYSRIWGSKKGFIRQLLEQHEEEHQKIDTAIWPHILMGCIFNLVLSIMLNVFWKNGGVLGAILVAAAGLAIIAEYLWKKRNVLFPFLHGLIQYLIEFELDHGDEKQKKQVTIGKTKLFLALMFAGIAVGAFFLYTYLDEMEAFFQMAVVILGIAAVLLYAYIFVKDADIRKYVFGGELLKEVIQELGEWPDRTVLQAGICVGNGMEQWEPAISAMCRKLQLDKIRVELSDGDYLAVSWMEDSAGVVQISKDAFSIFESIPDMEKSFQCICFIVAHELVHIYYKDMKRDMDKIMGILQFFSMAGMFAAVWAVTVITPLPWFGWVTAVGIILWMLLKRRMFRFLCDDRYWNQVKEFRADRIAMQVSGTAPETFYFIRDLLEPKEYKRREKPNRAYRLYETYVKPVGHPSLACRSKELERGVWDWREYFHYITVIRGNVVSGKGWKL